MVRHRGLARQKLLNVSEHQILKEGVHFLHERLSADAFASEKLSATDNLSDLLSGDIHGLSLEELAASRARVQKAPAGLEEQRAHATLLARLDACLFEALARHCLGMQVPAIERPEPLGAFGRGLLLILGAAKLLVAQQGGAMDASDGLPACWALRLDGATPGSSLALFRPGELRAEALPVGRAVPAAAAGRVGVLRGGGLGARPDCALDWEVATLDLRANEAALEAEHATLGRRPAISSAESSEGSPKAECHAGVGGLRTPRRSTGPCQDIGPSVGSTRPPSSASASPESDLLVQDPSLLPSAGPDTANARSSHHAKTPCALDDDLGLGGARGPSATTMLGLDAAQASCQCSRPGSPARELLESRGPVEEHDFEAKRDGQGIETFYIGSPRASCTETGSVSRQGSSQSALDLRTYLELFGFQLLDAVTWREAERLPIVQARVVAHEEVRGHTRYLLTCVLVPHHRQPLGWETTRRLAQLRAGVHDLIKRELGDAYERHFEGAPFAHRFAPRGTTARLDAWCQRLASCMSLGLLRPAVVAQVLQFLDAPVL